jgi:hypothetical protein
MVRGAIAFDPEHVSTRLVGILDRKVDEESSDADLMFNLVAKSRESHPDVGLEV